MIVGLYGDSRAGKDTVAEILVQSFGFVQRNMAAPIRKMLLDINPTLDGGVTLDHVYAQAGGDWDFIKQRHPDTVDLMIRLGQAARDHIGEDVWLNAAMYKLPEKLVIADVRQPNEYWKIKSFDNGQIWHIIRPGTTRRGMDGLLDGTEFDFDARIDNRGSIMDLRGQVQAIIATKINESYIQRVSK